MSTIMTTDREPTESSTAVVEAVASAKGVDEVDLPPLNDAVDPDALNALFKPRDDPEGLVTFTYADCEVTVFSNDRVDVSI